jgi:sarcosine oxidase gamma subunit
MQEIRTSFSMSAEMKADIEALLSGPETISQFAFKATEEKIKRMQQRDARARQQSLMRDVEALRPVVEEIVRSMCAKGDRT